MGRIKIISESEADGDLKSMYDEIADKRGGVSEVIKIHSLLPKTMRDHMNLYMTLMFEQRHTGIKRKQLEMMAVTVSAVNQCSYCVAHHSVPLGRLLRDDVLLNAIQTLDKETLVGSLSAEDNILVWLAEKITREPYNVSEEDINTVREHGFNDEQVLHIVLVINYFNFVNRNVLALGIELETDYEKACK